MLYRAEKQQQNHDKLPESSKCHLLNAIKDFSKKTTES